MNSVSNMPSVKVMLFGVDARKAAIFSMAFKMHSATNYQLVGDVDEADILVIDADGVDGEELWQKTSNEHQNLPKVYSSILEPKFDVAYLPKPVKIETLFPVLRAALSGLVTFKAADNAESSLNRERLSFKQQAFKNTLIDEPVVATPRDVKFPAEQLQSFDISKGLLGSLRQISHQTDNVALIVENKPILMYFADIDRVLLAVAPSKLEQMCHDVNLIVQMKKIGDHPEWKQHAKAQMDSCLWQFAIWTSQGRLPSDINVNQPILLRSWPNITRLAYIPDAMRLSAFLTKAPVNLPMTYKMIRVELTDLLNFVSACYVTNLLQVQQIAHAGLVGTAHLEVGNGNEQEDVNAQESGPSTPNVSAEAAKAMEVIATSARPKQSSSMLQRLLKKLTGK